MDHPWIPAGAVVVMQRDLRHKRFDGSEVTIPTGAAGRVVDLSRTFNPHFLNVIASFDTPTFLRGSVFHVQPNDLHWNGLAKLEEATFSVLAASDHPLKPSEIYERLVAHFTEEIDFTGIPPANYDLFAREMARVAVGLVSPDQIQNYILTNLLRSGRVETDMTAGGHYTNYAYVVPLLLDRLSAI